jgi:hypothetical protein
MVIEMSSMHVIVLNDYSKIFSSLLTENQDPNRDGLLKSVSRLGWIAKIGIPILAIPILAIPILAMRSWNLRILHFWQMSTKNARF